MSNRKTVNLALQGGGAHGAFGWGVLDYLLEDGRVDFEGITATSAGAMNAVVMAHGLSCGGPDFAREKLEEFWREVSRAGGWLSVSGAPAPAYYEDLANATSWSTFALMDVLTRTFSPYDYNPFDVNPLRDVLEKVVDFDQLQKCQKTKLFVCATNVETGRVKVFHTENIHADAVLASACLPFLFQAVEIDGETFWDGGYMGNPSLWPLFYHTRARDIVSVHLNPIERPGVPKRPSEIMNRVNEISFNSSLIKEMRSIAFVQRLIEQDMLKDEYKRLFKDVLFHSIRCDETLRDLSIASKFNTNWAFLESLRDRGRELAQRWLDEAFDDLNVRGTIDLHGEFLEQ